MMKKLLLVGLMLFSARAEAVVLMTYKTPTAAQATLTPAWSGMGKIQADSVLPTPVFTETPIPTDTPNTTPEAMQTKDAQIVQTIQIMQTKTPWPTPAFTLTPIPTNYYENYLGVPDADGKALVSTMAGIRTWAVMGGGAAWGSITGTLSNQTDLNTALGNRELTANKGAASGYCPLNSSTKIDTTYLAMGGNSQPASLNTSSKLVIGEIPTGSTANDVCVGNDARLSDARVPTSHGNGNHSSTFEDQANKGTASGYASLNASSKVVQDPANAQAVTGNAKIPISAASGVLATGWLGTGTADSGKVLYGDGTWKTAPGGGSSAPSTSLIADITIANTTNETKIISLLLPGGTLVVGSTYELVMHGQGGVTATAPTISYFMRYGTDDVAGTFVCGVTLTPAVSVVNRHFMYRGMFTCRTTGATGTAKGNAMVSSTFNTAVTQANRGSMQASTGTIDTTIDRYLVGSIKFSAASAANTITVYDAAIYCVKP